MFAQLFARIRKCTRMDIMKYFRSNRRRRGLEKAEYVSILLPKKMIHEYKCIGPVIQLSPKRGQIYYHTSL